MRHRCFSSFLYFPTLLAPNLEPSPTHCNSDLRLQEELAFAYEMMGLYEDALIQYDELDALFSQFVLNAGAIGSGTDGGGGGGGGGNRSTVGLDWLAGFAAIEVSEWNGLCLSFPINQVRNAYL